MSAPQQTFTVTLDYETAERLRDFCEEFAGVTPEAAIADGIHGTMQDAAERDDFRYALAGWVRDRVEAAEHELAMQGQEKGGGQ